MSAFLKQVYYDAKDPNIIALISKHYLPWHRKHAQVNQTKKLVQQQAQLLVEDGSGNSGMSSRQNQIMTYFKMYFDKKTA